jgi:hypothetical protein
VEGLTVPVHAVQVLHIDECPHWHEAAARVGAALAELGTPDIPVVTVLVDTPESATSSKFAGSPTILVDGIDLFPSAGATSALACRIYSTGPGLAGSPTIEQIVQALRERA